MSLRYALLGFLTTEPSSAYRLAQEFSESMGWFWHASHSQIQPELQRLEKDGFVTSAQRDADGRSKRIYSITDEGTRELERWLALDTRYPPLRDVERIRLIFLDMLELDAVRRHLEQHRAHHQGLLDTYLRQFLEVRTGEFGRLTKRLAARPPETHAVVTGLKTMALRGNVMRARTEIEWAEDGLLWVAEMKRTGLESDRHAGRQRLEQISRQG